MKCKGIRKIAHIIEELNLYFLDNNAEKIQIEINNDEDKVVIEAHAKIALSIEEVHHIKEMLHAHHEYEYDEYWHLMGEGAHCDELQLVGSLIDFSETKYENGIFYIRLERNK